MSHILNTCRSPGLLLLAAIAILPATSLAASPPTMCAKGDRPLFSCPLSGSKKTVSICLSGSADQGQGHYYYAYGNAGGRPDLTYPADGSEGEFTRTHLMFGGATGGYAYGFTNGGFKYIVYSISGTQLENQGLLVMKEGEKKPVKEATCQPGHVTQPDDRSIADPPLKWKPDPEIDGHGLPWS